MLQKLRENLKPTLFFLGSAGTLLIGFFIVQLLYRPEFWDNYFWIPEIGMILLYVGTFIACYQFSLFSRIKEIITKK
jgi:UDP-N-acetylmuramyl pentapeptide phosphotransferase/UDP-N-acetylglucosamine-1-phosphate transferase